MTSSIGENMPQYLRVYVALSGSDLGELRTAGLVDLSGRAVHCVTERVRRAFPQDDEDDLEYAALWDAAEAAPVQTRIVVAAADVPSGWGRARAPGDQDDPGAAYLLDLDRPLPRSAVVSLHVSAVDAGPQDELLWHDVSELDALGELG